MNRRSFLAGLLLWLAFLSSAFAAIGTPTDLGHASTSSAATLTITTGAAVSSGDLIVVIHVTTNSSATTNTITDTAGNTYTRISVINSASPDQEVFISPGSTAEASSSTIVMNFNGGNARHGISAFTVSGMVPNMGVWDQGSALSTTGTAITLTVNCHPIYAKNELALGFILSGSSTGALTPGGSWTAVGGSTTLGIVLPATQTLSSITDPLAWSPSWVSSVSTRASCMSFKGNPASNTSRQSQGTLTGVGQ